MASVGCRSRAGLTGVWLAAWLAAASVQPAAAANPAKAAAAPLQGTVSKVTDGDSLWFTPTGQPHIVVRLLDIDAPESCQAWGAEARQALADLALGKPATLKVRGRDVHGRVLGMVTVDEINVAVRQVEEGHAWSTRSRWDQGPLVKQERVARALRRGLHATGQAEMPRDFRLRHGPCEPGQAPGALAVGSARPVATTVPQTSPPGTGGNAYRCDGRTHCAQMRSCDEAKYFLARCPGVKMDGDHDGVPCEDQWCR